MYLTNFIKNFADQLDDTDPSLIKPGTKFRELEEWSSLTGMCLIAMVKTNYGKTLTGTDLRSCQTVEDIYHVVMNK